MRDCSGVFISCCLLAFVGCFATTTYAEQLPPDQSSHCDQAAAYASDKNKVPLDVLRAIARTESGITVGGEFVPWPWTINVGGEGVWMASKTAAVSHAKRSLTNGARNIDVGCFQLNHRWHGEHFASIEAMIDPIANADYAARFLVTLYEEFGEWSGAIRAYHSRNEEISDRYIARLAPIFSNLSGQKADARPPARIQIRANRFPLLQGRAQSGSFGSLFPNQNAASGSLLSRRKTRG